MKERWTAAGSKTTGNWEAVFGPGAPTEPEVFMAWNYAHYCDQVAAAGQGRV